MIENVYIVFNGRHVRNLNAPRYLARAQGFMVARALAGVVSLSSRLLARI